MLISIIIPVHNTAKYLNQCLDSVIKQSYTKLEIICIENDSTDNSLAILNDYAKKDSRIKVISQKGGGIAAARNKGLELANGDYIGFVDSDDYIAPNMYETLLNNMASYDMVACAYSTFNNTDDKLNTIKVSELNPALWNKLLKKQIFTDNNIRFPQNCGQDTAIFYKILYYFDNYKIINEALYFYRQHEDQSMKSDPQKFLDAVPTIISEIYAFMAKQKLEQAKRLELQKYIYTNFMQKYISIIVNFHKENDLAMVKKYIATIKPLLNDEFYYYLNERVSMGGTEEYKILGLLTNRVNFTMFYFRPANFVNFGDELNPYLVKKLFNYSPILDGTKNVDLLAIGSVLQNIVFPKYNILKRLSFFSNKVINIWGSGFINKETDEIEYSIRPLKVHAVRGKYSKERLEKMLDKPLNIPLGDPGLLVSKFFTKSVEKKYEIGIIPHYVDIAHPLLVSLKDRSDIKIIDITQPNLDSFIEEVCMCKTILSSSLHGLITADAFLIPNQWVVFSKAILTEYKFKDYYSAFGIEDEMSSLYLGEADSTILDDLKVRENYKITKDMLVKIQDGLIKSFPSERDLVLDHFDNTHVAKLKAIIEEDKRVIQLAREEEENRIKLAKEEEKNRIKLAKEEEKKAIQLALEKTPKYKVKKVIRAIIGKPIKRIYEILNLY